MQMKYLYTKIFTTLKKEIEEDTSKWKKISHVHGSIGINTAKTAILTKQLTDSMKFPSNFQQNSLQKYKGQFSASYGNRQETA